MKRILFLLALTLLFSCLAGCALNQPSPADAETYALETNAPTAETTAPVMPAEAEYLQDFSVQTIDGETFSLSEALETHEMVLVNLFATWCPPCKMEFPYLQEAWTQEQDRVAVIALSVEPTDSLDVLRTFADDMGLTFAMGRTDGTNLDRFVTEGIPTTIVVDRTGKIAKIEIGAMSSAQQFLDLFDEYSGADYDPSLCTYTVRPYNITDNDGIPVEGLIINFCTDMTCTPVTTDSDGAAHFTGHPAKYHVQIVSVPDGWQLAGDSEWTTEPYGQTFWIPFREDGK